ncbi:MAG: ArnT family glycosyltransferase [Terriglobia bacterium]
MKWRWVAWVAIVLGTVTRLFFAIAPGKAIAARWSGVSDAPAYVLLAHNVARGMGLSYCGMPAAIRPPLYPLFLAALIVAFGNGFIVAARILQFFAGLLTAYLCYATAKRLWGDCGALLAGAAALLMPTLVYLAGEIMTEPFAALVVAGFLFLLLQQLDSPRLSGWVLIGVLVGLGTLIRFNLAVLGIVAVCVAWRTQGTRKGFGAAALTTLAAAVMIAPWVTRNLREFHGKVILGSQTGFNMVQGLITPEGRALPGDSKRLICAEGWKESDIETSDALRRHLYPDEGTLNSNTTRIALRMWRSAGIKAAPVIFKKFGYFWLETDQLLSFAGRGVLVRRLGVAVWWAVLGCAIGGWLLLKGSNAAAARALLLYAALVTLLHVPFVMNTRLGAPFLAPLACVLFPGGPILRKAIQEECMVRASLLSESGEEQLTGARATAA